MDSINNYIVKFSVFLDTNVLYKSYLRDLILRLAETGVFKVHWSNEIIEELRRNIEKVIVDQVKIDNLLNELSRAFPHACIKDEINAGSIKLSAKSDRHIVASAILGRCDLIVTENIKDFPEDELQRYDLESQHPDEFLLHFYSLEQTKMLRTIRQQLLDMNNPELTFAEYLEVLENAGCTRFAQKMRDDGVEQILYPSI